MKTSISFFGGVIVSFCINMNINAQERLTNWRSSINVSSNPTGFSRLGDKVYFAAEDYENGSSVWETDGTIDGTRIFHKSDKRLSSNSFKSISVNDTLYYIFDKALWKVSFDLAPVKIAEIPAKIFNGFSYPQLIKNTIFFSINKSYDIRKGVWQSTSNFEEEHEDNYPYNWGKILKADDFLVLRYHWDVSIEKAKDFELRDSTNRAIFIEVPKEHSPLHIYNYKDKRFALFSYHDTNRIFEIKNDSLELVNEYNFGYSQNFYSTHFVGKKDSLFALFASENHFNLYQIEGDSATLNRKFPKTGIDNYTFAYLDFNSFYFVENDTADNSNKLWRLNFSDSSITTIDQNLLSGNPEPYGEPKFLDGKTVGWIRIYNGNNSYSFSPDKKRLIQRHPLQYYPGKSEFLGDYEISIGESTLDNGVSDLEVYRYGEDTLQLKNILEFGKPMFSYPHFSHQNNQYFISNDSNYDIALFKLNDTLKTLNLELSLENNTFPSNYSGEKLSSPHGSGIVFNNNNYYDSGGFYTLLDDNKPTFNWMHSESFRKSFLNSNGEIVLIFDNKIEIYNFIDKTLSKLYEGDFIGSQFKYYKDYIIYRSSDKKLTFLNTKDRSSIVTKKPIDRILSIWNNNILTLSNDSLHLFELDNNFEKRFLKKISREVYFIESESNDSIFVAQNYNTIIASDGSCKGTIEILKDSTIISPYHYLGNGFSDKIIVSNSENIIVYQNGIISSFSINSADHYNTIVSKESIFFLKGNREYTSDSLMKASLQTGEVSFVSLITPNEKLSQISLSTNTTKKETGIIYFTAGYSLFYLDTQSDNLQEIKYPKESWLSTNIYTDAGTYDYLSINNKPYLLDKSTFSLIDLPFPSVESYFSPFVRDTKNHWMIVHDNQVVIANKRDGSFKLISNEFGHIADLIISNSKLFATVKEEIKGYQIWYLGGVEGLYPLSIEQSKEFRELPKNDCPDLISETILSTEQDVPLIILYPNPSKGSFMLRLNHEVDSKPIFQIYDNIGRSQDYKVDVKENGEYEFRLKSSKSSAYILKIKTQNGEFLKKILTY